MSRSAGPGSPVFFACSVARRNRDWWTGSLPRGHVVKRTGRTRPRAHRRSVGVRSLLVEHEYRCQCGHVGWTNHVDIEQRPVES